MSIFRAQLISFDNSDWTAVVLLDGSVSEVVMPVGQWVPDGMLAADDAVAVLLFDDSNPDDGVVLGPFGGLGAGWSYPELSGLTAGQPLRATGAAAAAFGALDLANANAVTNALPHGKGGIGLSGTPANGQLPIGNGSGYTLANVTGTANQVVVTNGAGTITLSLPQNVHTGASPTFAGLTLSGLTATRIPFAGLGGALGDDADLAFDGAQLKLAAQGSSGGVLLGGDVQFYRAAANLAQTPDSLKVEGGLAVGTESTTTAGEIKASGNVKSDGAFFPGDEQGRVEYRNLALAAGGTSAVCATNLPYGFLFVAETDATGQVAIYVLHGGAGVVTEISDPSGVYGTTSGASSYNIYYSAGNSRYEIQNNTAGARRFRIMCLILTTG